jgi:riboflavin transporter FmnP
MKETALHPARPTQRLVTIPMLAAVGFILQLLEFPIPLMPSFLKLDFSTLPALIGGLVYGPVAGILIEVIKNALHMLFKNADGLIVGEIANVLAGACFILVPVIMHRLGKGKSGFILGLGAGTLLMTVAMGLFNAWFLLPAYAALYQMPLDQLLASFGADSVWSLVLYGITPFNIFKGAVLSIVAYLLYVKLAARLQARTIN